MGVGRDGWFAWGSWPWILAVAGLAGACRDTEGPPSSSAAGEIRSTAAAVGRREGATRGTTAGSAIGAPPNQKTTPTRYDPDAVFSPITPAVARHLRALARHRPRQDDVFIKVGASGTASGHFLNCFAAGDSPRHDLVLGEHTELGPTLEFFRGGRAAGRTPFDRFTRAAVSGKTAGWVLEGTPSPLEAELAALDPRFAFVAYGTNDMNYGVSPRAALASFYRSLSQVLDRLESGGTIPLVTGLPPRDHDRTRERWVRTYDVVTRGIAEARQLPYLSLYLATKDLPNQGLSRDGIHGNAYFDRGAWRPCVFTAPALGYHYNRRNLFSLQLLDVVKRVVVDGARAPDTEPPSLIGDGTILRPFVIDHLPFTHTLARTAATKKQPKRSSPCGATAFALRASYELTLEDAAPIRILALHRGSAKHSLEVIAESGSSGRCVARGSFIEHPLDAGRYQLRLLAPKGSGSHLVVVLRCDAGDPDCMQ